MSSKKSSRQERRAAERKLKKSENATTVDIAKSTQSNGIPFYWMY